MVVKMKKDHSFIPSFLHTIYKENSAALIIAIDGASASGKSSLAQVLAEKLNLAYLDTGIMYRALTWCVLDQQLSSDAAIIQQAQKLPYFTQISLTADHQTVNYRHQDITDQLRTSEINAHVSSVSKIPEVRSILIRWQQKIVREQARIILEGRDTTTVVAPDADLRLLLIADSASRQSRRDAQTAFTAGAGSNTVIGQAEQIPNSQSSITDSQPPTTNHQPPTTDSVTARDAIDRTVNDFTNAAPGVITIDNTNLTLEQTVTQVLQLLAERNLE
jgi:cytidylate kinase